MALKLQLIDYQAVGTGHPVDGATKFGQELSSLLLQEGVELRRHRFEDVLQGSDELFSPRAAPILSAAGPYAYLYHYWREKKGLDIPIIRDIHSGPWTGYLMQEWLCASLTRPGDGVVFPSEFAKALFERLFPESLRGVRTLVAHPMYPGDSFPAWAPRALHGSGTLRVGYIGRLSRDKNLPALVQGAALLGRQLRGRTIELHILGGASGLDRNSLRELWEESGGNPAELHYWGYRQPQSEVDRFFQTLDILGFPSTSNIEALGRVVVEARYWSVRTLMSRHGAANELVPPRWQVPVNRFSHAISCHNGSPLGTTEPADVASGLESLLAEDGKPPRLREERFLSGAFVRSLSRLLEGGELPAHEEGSPVSAGRITLPATPGREQALALTEKLLEHLSFWSGKLGDAQRLQDELASMTGAPERTAQFLEDVEGGRVNYADTSSFPFHLAQLADFHPTVQPAH